MFNLKKSMLVAAIALMSVGAQAGVLVEPYVGVAFGDGDAAVDTVFIGTPEYDYISPAVGARVGYEFNNILVGADFSYEKMTINQTADTDESEFDASKYQLAVFAGYQFEMPFRAWIAFNVMNSLSNDDTNQDYEGLGGINVGGSYTGLPFGLAANLEFRSYEYDTEKIGGYDQDLSMGEVFLSVSAPFNFDLF